MKTIQQAADDWGVTPQCVRNWIKAGIVTATQIGERSFIKRQSKPKTDKPGPKRLTAAAK